MPNEALQDALDIARVARDGAVESAIKDALDDTIQAIETKLGQ